MQLPSNFCVQSSVYTVTEEAWNCLGAEFGEKQSQNRAVELAPNSTDNSWTTSSIFSIAEAPSVSSIKVYTDKMLF